MKPMLVTVAAAAILFTGLTLYADRPAPAIPPHPDARVLEVLRHCLEDKRRYSKPARNGKYFVRGPQYVSALGKIDASQCPHDFQLAWKGYCDSWSERVRQIKAENGEILFDVVAIGAATMATGGVATVAAAHAVEKKAVGDALKAAKSPLMDTRQQWQSVEKQAVICNCKMPENIEGF